MITLLRSSQRYHATLGQQEVWRSFHAPAPSEFLAQGFGFLSAFDELRLPPGQSTQPQPKGEVELVSYVYRGALSQADTNGYSGVLCAGEFQRVSGGGSVRYTETSVSRSDWVHWFRVSLRPWQAEIDHGREQQRFTAGQRHHVLCVVASPDRRKGSLGIHQDVLVYSAILESGHHVVHELKSGRRAWLHVVHGEATMADVVLGLGDGVGVVNERALVLTVREPTEILMIDMGPERASAMPLAE